jgi:hypothetical protein
MARGAEASLEAEHLAEGAHHISPRSVECWRALAELALHRRHHHALNPARHYQVEVGEVVHDIEREAVPGDPPARVHSDGSDLAPPRPDSGESVLPPGIDPPPAERADQHLLERAQVPVQILPVLLEVQDGIPHELSRSVERRVAAALHLEELHPARREKLSLCRAVAAVLRLSPERDHGWMLHEQKHIVLQLSRDPLARQLPLQLQSRGIAEVAQVVNGEEFRRGESRR